MKIKLENPAPQEIAVDLFNAIYEKQEAIASKLIEQFPESVNQANEKGYYPIQIAAKYGLCDLLPLLIEKTKIESFQNDETPLLFALSYKQKQAASLLIIPKWVNQSNNNGVVPLHLAAQEGYEDIIQALIDSGANTQACNAYEITPLMAAIGRNHDKVAPQLIKAFPTWVNQPDQGIYPLARAIIKGMVNTVVQLIENNAELNFEGYTPLTFALQFKNEIEERNKDFFPLLIQQCPKLVNQTAGKNNPPLCSAANKGFLDIINLLLANGADGIHSLNQAILRDDEKALSLLKEIIPDWMNQHDNKGMYPLRAAAQKGLFDLVKMILNQNTYINDLKNFNSALKAADKEILIKPLEVASVSGNPEVVELLLSYQYETKHLKQCLHFAASDWITSQESKKQQQYRCSEILRNKLRSIDATVYKLESYCKNDWTWCFEDLYSKKPELEDLDPGNKDQALRHAITSSYELLLNPQACIPYLHDLSQKLEEAWKNEYPDELWVQFDVNTIELWSHQGFQYPIPNDQFKKGVKKHNLLECLQLAEYKKHGMGEAQYKWTGYVNKKFSVELLSKNPIFKENGRTINGLFHGNVHNIQRMILLEAMNEGYISLKYKENGQEKTLAPKEVFSALMRRDIAFKASHPPLWVKVLDKSPFEKASFTLPHCLHSMLLTHEKLAGMLQDYLRFSFCNTFIKMHELFDIMCNKVHTTSELLYELKKFDLLNFTASPKEAIEIENQKAHDKKVGFICDKDEKVWSVTYKHYTPLLFAAKEIEKETPSFSLGIS